MRRLIILISLSLLCGSLKLKAQSYVPFPDSNAVWAMECCAGFQCELHWYAHYWIGVEDTTIGGKEYNKLFRYLQDSGIVDQYIGAYRNDTAQRRVYYVEAPDTSEILIYDFSLSYLDTFQIPFPKMQCNSVTDAVLMAMDSVLVGSEYRRTFVFNTVRMDEGIGSQAGLFEYYGGCFEYECVLRCFKSGDTITLGSPWSCNLATDGINESGLKKIEVQFHPNPLQNISTIQFSKDFNAESVMVYNLLGQRIYKQSLEGHETAKLYRRDFEPGVYSFIITGGGGSETLYGTFTVM